MPNYTPNLNLVKPLGSENYDISKVTNDNADKIDLLLAPKANPTFTGNVSGITKAMVGLGNVDNTSDANKPISTATQTALDGKLSLTGGTLTGLLTTNGQIRFPATQNPSADANTLDDYEEGTFTPTLTAQTGTLTSYTSSGNYVKVGNTVSIYFTYQITNKGTASGNIYASIPFTAKQYYQAVVGWDSYNTAKHMVGYVDGASVRDIKFSDGTSAIVNAYGGNFGFVINI